jgi:hypothetical protein
LRRTIRILALAGTIATAFALGCAEPTAPHSDDPCSGGGSQGWDVCATGTSIHTDTTMTTQSNTQSHP